MQGFEGIDLSLLFQASNHTPDTTPHSCLFRTELLEVTQERLHLLGLRCRCNRVGNASMTEVGSSIAIKGYIIV